MNISITEEKGVSIIDLNGNLDTNTSPEVEKSTNALIAADKHKIIMDLSNTGFVSSAGLRIFLSTAKQLTAKGGVFKICSPNDVVKEILDMSGFSTILDVKNNLEEAVSAM